MWYPNETDQLICHEQYKDRQRAAEHDRLVAEAKEQNHSHPGQRIKGWLGGYMIRIGLKLQQVETDVAGETYIRTQTPVYELSPKARIAPRR